MEKLSKNGSKEQEQPMGLERSSMNAQQQELSEKYGREIKNDEILKRDPVPGTMFHIMEIETGCFIVIGNKRITNFMTREQCEDMIINREWHLIETAIMIVSTAMNEELEKKLTNLINLTKNI